MMQGTTKDFELQIPVQMVTELHNANETIRRLKARVAYLEDALDGARADADYYRRTWLDEVRDKQRYYDRAMWRAHSEYGERLDEIARQKRDGVYRAPELSKGKKKGGHKK